MLCSLPVFDAHVIEIAQLPLVHNDPHRCAEESVFDACWFPKRGFGGLMAVYPMGSGRLFKCVRLNDSGGTPNEGVV